MNLYIEMIGDYDKHLLTTKLDISICDNTEASVIDHIKRMITLYTGEEVTEIRIYDRLPLPFKLDLKEFHLNERYNLKEKIFRGQDEEEERERYKRLHKKYGNKS